VGYSTRRIVKFENLLRVGNLAKEEETPGAIRKIPGGGGGGHRISKSQKTNMVVSFMELHRFFNENRAFSSAYYVYNIFFKVWQQDATLFVSNF
jgi:hypothetical protein